MHGPALPTPRIDPGEAPPAAADFRATIIGKQGQLEPIRDIRAFSRRAGVDVREVDLGAAEGGCEAVIAPRDTGGFVVMVDPTPRGGWSGLQLEHRREVTRQRLRFRVAHELGHTLFYDCQPGRAPSRSSAGSKSEETFCDRFASSLLLPDAALAKCFSPSHLLQLQRRFDISLEAAARAWSDVHGTDAALLYRSDAQEPWEIQWTNAASRVARAWRLAIGRSTSETSAVQLPKQAQSRLVPRRRQALILASSALAA
jgi:hypothetical protein